MLEYDAGESGTKERVWSWRSIANVPIDVQIIARYLTGQRWDIHCGFE